MESHLPGIGDWVSRWAERRPDGVALIFEGQTWTYGDLHEQVRSVASRLQDAGVGHGSRVAYLGANHPALLITLFACASIGAALTPINWRLASPEVQFIVDDSDASLLIYDAGLVELVGPLRDRRPSHFFAVNDPETGIDLPTPAASSNVVPHLRPGAGDDLAALMYTSGTSGRPKGAMISHLNLLASIVSHDSTFGIAPGHVALVAAPLFHIGALNVDLLNTLLKGGTVVLERGFDPGRVLALIEEHEVQSFFAAPVMLQMLAAHPAFEQTNLDSIRWIFCGGSPVPTRLINLYAARGVDVCQGLGMTEATPMVASMVPTDPSSKFGSVGKPSLLVDVRAVDENGERCPAGQRGEIVLRGANIISGYWNRPQDNAAAFRNGWFHTGDVGVFDEDGYLFVVDRLKDIIISGGENIASAEVEAALIDHPTIAEVAVVARAHEKWGEVPVAYVVPAPGQSINQDALRAHASERLAAFKRPVDYRLMEALPRNASGKILKHQLREQESRTPAEAVGTTTT